MVSILATVRDAIRKRQQKPFVSVTQDIIDLKSPLIECCEGDLVPGVVPIKDRQLCNDATILSESPLSVIMPRQQWSYGLLLPINHARLAGANEEAVVRFEMAVRNGIIGIAGVDAALAFTTVEQFVGEGRASITLPIDRAKKTKAFVLRTTSAQNESPEVTLFEITAQRPINVQLVRRRHGLAFDLFVILSPGKTATQTIEQTILALDPSVQVRRVHFLSSNEIEYRRNSARLKASPQTRLEIEQLLALSENVKREIEIVRTLGGSIAFVTCIRDPIDRAIASMFQLIHLTLPIYADLHKTGPWLVKLLSEAFITSWKQELNKEIDPLAEREFIFGDNVRVADGFFTEEFSPFTGMDIRRHPFNRDAGYTVLENGNTSALIFRYEDIERGLAAGLSALTGRKDIRLIDTNRSADKPYAGVYRDFRSVFRVPADLCSAIYENSPYIRHFYSDAEIAQFKARWSDSDSVNRNS